MSLLFVWNLRIVMITNLLSLVSQRVVIRPRECVVVWPNTAPTMIIYIGTINSLAPGKFELNFRHVIFKQILMIDGWGISCEIALIWMLLVFTGDQSTLVQVMAWCRQATSHYLSQCWPRYRLPYGVPRPQWVKTYRKNLNMPCMPFVKQTYSRY